jgi:hypothetical protein
MSGHFWNGSAWVKAKTLGFPDNTTGVMREVKEAYIWNGSAFVRVYVKARVYRDDFNRANTDDIGLAGAWDTGVMSNPRLRIRSNIVEAGDASDGSGRQAAGWAQNWTPLNRDVGYVKVQLANDPSWSLASNNFTTIGLGWPNTFASGTMCYLSMSTGDGTEIVTCNGSPNGPGNSATEGSNQTLRASGANVAQTDLIEFRRTRNLSTGVFTYAAFKNGSSTSFVSWTDSTGVVPFGPNFRRYGFCIETNDPFLQAQFASPGVDWIEAGDL